MTIAAFRNDLNAHNPSGSIFAGTIGASEAANRISDDARNCVMKLVNSSVYRSMEQNDIERVTTKLLSVAHSAKAENWDGYGAKGITSNVIKNTLKCINHLPIDQTLFCDFSAEPDGEIAIEWFSTANDIFSISVGDTKKINFAGSFRDGNKINGVINFEIDDIKALINYISKTLK